MKIVKNFPSRMLAEQAKEYLQKNGIESIIQSLDLLFGSSGGSFFQGADLTVQEKDYERAKELIYNTYKGI